MTQVKLPECLEPGHRIAVASTTADGKPAVLIRANREGMVTLARLFLFMTQPNVPPGVSVDLGIAGAVDAAAGLNVLIQRE